MIRFLLALLLLAAAGLASPAAAQTFPALSGRVVDAAAVIPDDVEAELTAKLEAIETEKGQQFVVATVPSLEGQTIENYGYLLGRHWAIGRREIDDGVILLVAPNERKVRIEVGYGLTPVLTAQLSGLIIREQILPRFRDGDMPGGIVAGADAVLEQLRLPAPVAEQRAQRILAEQEANESRGGGGGSGWVVLFWIAVMLFILVPIIWSSASGTAYRGKAGRRRRRGPVVVWGPSWGSGGSSSSSGSSWSSGGSSWGGGGGGGFSGGGGSFGGGGASGSW